MPVAVPSPHYLNCFPITEPSLIAQIKTSTAPAIPSNISTDAQDFLLKTFDQDYEAWPDAEEVLQHPWVDAEKWTTREPRS
jgi:hypothetical protein